MFNIGAGELFIIFLVAFFVVGPKDLPKVIKGIKSALQTIKSLVKDLKAETGWDDIVKEVSETKDDLTGTFKSLDVTKDLKDAKKSIEGSVKDLDIQKDFQEAKKALEGGMNAIKNPIKAATTALTDELNPKAIVSQATAKPQSEPAVAAVPDAAPAVDTNSGPEAEKTEEKI